MIMMNGGFWPMSVILGPWKTEAGGIYKFKTSLGLKSGTPSLANSKCGLQNRIYLVNYAGSV